MEYWGINRSCESLRLDTIKRILDLGSPEDFTRVSSVLPYPQKGRVLVAKEAEILLALASSAAQLKAGKRLPQSEELKLAAALVRCSSTYLEEPHSLSQAALSNYYRRLGVCMNRKVAHDLTLYFGKAAESVVLDAFINEFNELWKDESSMSDSAFVAVFGALIGFLEGLAATNESRMVSPKLFGHIMSFCDHEFLTTTQSHLEKLSESFGLSNLIFLQVSAQIVLIYARGNPSDIKSVIEFSDQQLDQLEDAYRFHQDASPEFMPVIQSTMESYLRVLEVGLDQNALSLKEDGGLVVKSLNRALVDYGEQSLPLALTLSRLSAKSIGHNEQNLLHSFDSLVDYLVRLSPSSAFQAASQFTLLFQTYFVHESTRMSLLYTLSNKLTSEEFDIVQAGRGYDGAVQFSAALLSVIVGFITSLKNIELAGLAVTVLEQKIAAINDTVDCQIIETWGLLSPYLTPSKFQEVLNMLARVERSGKASIYKSVKTARTSIASQKVENTAHLTHLLDLIVLYGEPGDIDLVRNIFTPLAIVTTTWASKDNQLAPQWNLLEKFRNAWFNLAALGISSDNLKGNDLHDLKQIAMNSPPLVSEECANHVESVLQLNTVLCRGASHSAMKIQHHTLSKHGIKVNSHNSTVLTIFLAAAFLLEHLRSHAGSVSKLPHYFADTEFSEGEGHQQMTQLTFTLVQDYVRNIGFAKSGALPLITENLKALLVLSCHRVDQVRHVAVDMVTQIVNGIPAALCQRDTLYTLLDCLNLLGKSTINALEDEYSPKAIFIAHLSGIRLELSDSLEIRRKSLTFFEDHARVWISKVSNYISVDLRSNLYTYLARCETSGLGRKFALRLLSSEEVNDDFFAQCLLHSQYEAHKSSENANAIIQKLQNLKTLDELKDTFTKAAPYMKRNDAVAFRLAKESVTASFRIFTEDSITTGITFWHHTIRRQANLLSAIVAEVVSQCVLSATLRKGLFNRDLDNLNPIWCEMEYAPTNKKAIDHNEAMVNRHLAPHSKLLNGFLRSCMHNTILLSPLYLPLFSRLIISWLETLIHSGSLHSLARNLRLQVLNFSVEVLGFMRTIQPFCSVNKKSVAIIEDLIGRAGLSWYVQAVPQWPFGSNIRNQTLTLNLLRQFSVHVKNSHIANSKLLLRLITQEYNKISAWYEPLGTGSFTSNLSICILKTQELDVEDVHVAWKVNPHLAASLSYGWRHKSSQVLSLIEQYVRKNPLSVYNCAHALNLYLNGKHISHTLLYWTQVSPLESINLLLPPYGNNPIILQYALRSLQTHDVKKCFFYVPQIVQQLRHDESGHIEEYILETAKFSQKFAHQIIWNIMANMYIDDEGSIPDPMKPRLDLVLQKLRDNFTEDEKKFYETEFQFFAEITSISGKLKPYIKASKQEKKVKIDEEMKAISLPEGVYLPSHPDGTVVDIDRLSGKPLQSHAKAPFLAKFKLRVDVEEVSEENVMNLEIKTKEIWQGAIFKVGDDCRQDVLALQVISVFRSIFNFCGLDVYVFPYKVIATAAGRGVIDVLPNSISRDMLGREAVNGLDQWYRSKHGGPDSIGFQRARLNFVKSMAAYSVISYLIQFKDRHNGNIMYDDDGHVIHIDFGFCFDITPGGVRFEAAPFKLTKEMTKVMGGANELPFRWFEELCVRAFLASRVFVDDICRVVQPMLNSGLPCFKGQTIKRLRERFVLKKTEAEAAQYMRSLISKSYESTFTKGYDEFQRLTNGIPY